ncbi:MAG: NAD-dependent epimerase [Alphaproteobacteria bacterium]|nr:NAD-dependent epimerase [Alphaproteobacteria bacterium]
MAKILVTGAAGFIGFHTVRRLCMGGHEVFGFDNLNDYYDVSLKEARLAELAPFANFTFEKADLADRAAMEDLFARWKPDIVVHLAAQAGVRYSIDHPHAYVDSNLQGFVNVLEGCRHTAVKHLIFASSSSVYGANTKLPFSVSDNVDHPISLYAATKKANELMAHSYAHLYALPCTGLRFFTVYGPWGRPDMAVYGFAKAIMEGRPIEIYNHGDMQRDFTYIDDVITGIENLLERMPAGPPPYQLYNIGNNRPEKLMDLIALLEKETGREAIKTLLPMQPGDVHATYADTADLERDTGFKPSTTLAEGIKKFIVWYNEYNATGEKAG